MLRVRIEPSPGRASNDSVGETFTSGLRFRGRTAGCAFGTGMPSPSATCLASSASTFTSCDTARSRIAGTWTLVSSNRNPRAICAFSIGDWLL